MTPSQILPILLMKSSNKLFVVIIVYFSALLYHRQYIPGLVDILPSYTYLLFCFKGVNVFCLFILICYRLSFFCAMIIFNASLILISFYYFYCIFSFTHFSYGLVSLTGLRFIHISNYTFKYNVVASGRSPNQQFIDAPILLFYMIFCSYSH